MYETIRRLHRVLYIVPIALLSLHTGLSFYDLLSHKANSPTFYLFSAGLFAGWLSFLTGVISFSLLTTSKVGRGLAFIHGFINSIALLVLTVLWAQDASSFPAAKPLEAPELFFKLLMILLLAAGSFLGKSALRKHLRRFRKLRQRQD